MPTKKRLLSLIKFGIVGIGTIVIDVATYALLVRIGINYLVADVLNLPLLLGFNFVAHKYFTFKTASNQTKKELKRYSVSVAFNFVLALVLLAIFVDLLHTLPVVGKIIQVIVLPILNYFLLEKFVFRAVELE